MVTNVQKDLGYFSYASRECDEYLTVLRLKVTEPNTVQKWASQYEELLDLSGRLQKKIESFGDVPLANHPHRFAIEYLHSIVLFRSLKDCQGKIESNAFSVPEAEDLYMRYTDEKTRIKQGLVAFGSSDRQDSLLAVTLLLTTLKLHVALSKKAVTLLRCEFLVQKYTAIKHEFSQNLWVRSHCMGAVDFLILMLRSYQSHLLRHYQDNIKHRSKLFESLRLDQMKIDTGELSLDQAQALLNKWDGIESHTLMHGQGSDNGAFDSLFVAINRLRFNLMGYVKYLNYIEPQGFNPDGFLDFSQVQPPEVSNASYSANEGSGLSTMTIAEYLTSNSLPDPLQKRQRVR